MCSMLNMRVEMLSFYISILQTPKIIYMITYSKIGKLILCIKIDHRKFLLTI